MSKLNDADGVRLRMTQLGNVAVILPLVYLDQQAPDSTELALVLSRADAGKLAGQLAEYASRAES